MKQNIPSICGNPAVAVGDTIKILALDDPYSKDYPGKTGTVTLIDDANTLHGTWGGLGVLPDVDAFMVVPA